MHVLNYVAIGIGIVGVGVITWGVLVASIELIALELKRIKGKNICEARETLRHHLGSYLLLGLEILVAADIVHTILDPGPLKIAILGGIVAIRTILNYFLNKEMGEHSCEIDSSSRAPEAAIDDTVRSV